MLQLNENYSNGANATVLSTSTSRNEVKLINTSNFLGREINVYGSVENPLFLAKDVAEWIEHSDVSTMVRTVDEDEKLTQTLFVSGQRRECNFLTEDGLYEVLMQSRKPIAKQFKKVVKEILKTIRKTGGYLTTKADDTPEEIMARALIVAQDTINRKEERLKELQARIEQQQVVIEQKEEEISVKDEKIKVLAPKGDSFDKIMSSEGLVTTNMITAFLGISAIKLNKMLCDWDIQYKQSGVYFLHAKYRGKGYTKHVPHPYMDNGVQKSREHMYWTEAGRKFVVDLYNLKLTA